MYLRTLFRSLVRRPQRVLVAVLAVAMGVGMAVALASVSLVLGDRLGQTVRQYGANLVLVPRGADLPLEIAGVDYSSLVEAGAAAIPESALAGLGTFRWRNNILGLAPQSYAIARLRRGARGEDGAAPRAVVIGTWFDRALPAEGGTTRPAGMKSIAPWWKVEGALPDEAAVDGPIEALAGRALARRLGYSAGGDPALELQLDGVADPVPARIVGVLDAGGFEDDHLYIPLARLQRVTGTEGTIRKVLVSALVIPGDAPPMPDPARDLAAFEQWSCQPYALTVGHEIEGAMPGVTARPIAQLVRGEGRLVGRLNLLMLLLTGAALTAAVLGVMSTMVASVADRTGEIALLRALGASSESVARLFLGEALVVAALGGGLGLALGWGLAQFIGQGAFGVAVEIEPLLAPAALALAALVCLGGAWLPVRRAGAIDPARILRAGA